MSARMRRAFAAALCLFAVAAAPASAAQPDCTGRGVPVNKISIQEFTFAEFIGFGTAARDAGAARGDARLPARHGLPQHRAVHAERPLGRRRCARCSTSTASRPPRATSTSARPRRPSTSTRSSRRTGSSASSTSGPARRRSYTTEAQWIAYAEYLDALGERARKAGQTLMIHNHNWEFETSFADTTAYEILLAQHRPAQRRLPGRPVLVDARPRHRRGRDERRAGRRPLRGARPPARQPRPAVPRQGHGDDHPGAPRSRAGSRSSARAGSTSRRSSPRARAR